MNLRLAILLVSLGANVVLVAFVAIPRPPLAPQIQRATGNKSVTPAAMTSGQVSVISGEPAVALHEGSAFRWSQLESQDYKEYISRLRGFGVPERVIRDIIIADVQKLYRPRFAALRPSKKPANPNFWETRNQGFYPNRDQTKEQREQTRALQKEQTDLIKTLLGADVYELISKDSGQPDWTERMYGPLSKEEREKISEMQQRFQEALTDIYAKAEGYIDQDTQAEVAALRRKHRDELATVLTPEQLFEYELRNSEITQTMRWELSSFSPSESEFRSVFAYKQALQELDKPQGIADDETPLTPEQRKAQQQSRKEAEEALKTALGEDRLKEYKLMDRYEYRNLLEAGISKENVFKVSDMRGEVELAAQKVRQDKSLSNEQRTEALRAIKAETEKALTEMLGERRAKYYSSSGGWWLRNLAPSP